MQKDFRIADGKLHRWYRGNWNLAGCWFDKSSGYWKVKYKNRSWLMHRLIFLLDKGWLPEIVGHEDRDVHNNDPSNLRPCSYRGENTVNSEARSDNTSGYKGVTWHKATQKWMASVFYKGKRYHLGVFKDIEEAAKAYDKKATELFNEFPVLNKG